MIIQLYLAVTGVIAVGLSQQRSLRLRKWSPIFGLLSQPAWFYETWIAGQWGIFALSFMYFIMWCIGFYNYWVKK